MAEGELNYSAHRFLRESLTSALSSMNEILLFLMLVLRLVDYFSCMKVSLALSCGPAQKNLK